MMHNMRFCSIIIEKCLYNSCSNKLTVFHWFLCECMTIGHSGPLTPTVGVSSPFEGKYLINIINYLI